MALSVAQWAQISTWFTNSLSGTSRQVTGVSWSAGDVIVVIGGIEDSANSLALGVPTNANLTFAEQASATDQNNQCEAYVWTATAGNAQTSQTISSTQTQTSASFASGLAVWVITGSPSGTANATANFTESSISRTVSAGSVVIYGLMDFNATNPPGKTMLTGSGSATERLDQGNGTDYGQYLGEWVGTSAGTFSFGPNNYTSLQVAQVIIEVLAPATATSLAWKRRPSGLIYR